MTIQINIPEVSMNDAERVAILSGKPNASELVGRLRAATEPIDITAALMNTGDKKDVAQLFIGLVFYAMAETEIDKQ